MRRSSVTGKDIIYTRYIPCSKEILADRGTINATQEVYERYLADQKNPSHPKIPSYPIKHWGKQTEKGRAPPTLVQ